MCIRDSLEDVGHVAHAVVTLDLVTRRRDHIVIDVLARSAGDIAGNVKAVAGLLADRGREGRICRAVGLTGAVGRHGDGEVHDLVLRPVLALSLIHI